MVAQNYYKYTPLPIGHRVAASWRPDGWEGFASLLPASFGDDAMGLGSQETIGLELTSGTPYSDAHPVCDAKYTISWAKGYSRGQPNPSFNATLSCPISPEIRKSEARGPIMYGRAHPGCHDCNGCYEGLFACKGPPETEYEFLVLEFSLDVELCNTRFNTSQESIVEYLSQKTPRPSVLVLSTGALPRLSLSCTSLPSLSLPTCI